MNEKEVICEDFNRIARLEEKKWDHNRHYHRYLAKWIPHPAERVLDVGCGIGEFTRILAARSQEVIGLDLSPVMLEKAREHSQSYPNISYHLRDVMEWRVEQNQYDCVVSIAAVHHLPLERYLSMMRDALRPGGMILILDLYKMKTLGELLLNVLAAPLNILMQWLTTGSSRGTEEERQAWNEHCKHDTYMTIHEIREICSRILPGAKVKRHLFWRYSLVWRKP